MLSLKFGEIQGRPTWLAFTDLIAGIAFQWPMKLKVIDLRHGLRDDAKSDRNDFKL